MTMFMRDKDLVRALGYWLVLIQSNLCARLCFLRSARLGSAGSFPGRRCGTGRGYGGFMLRGADIRFEWRLDLDRVGVGVGVGAAFSKCK
jgi:hypothetical protein